MLQVGDQAAYTRIGRYGYREWTTKIDTVSKVTPGGQVVLGNGMRFNKHGYEIGNSQESRSHVLLPVEQAREIYAAQKRSTLQKNLVAKALEKLQKMTQRAGNLSDEEVALLENLVK